MDDYISRQAAMEEISKQQTYKMFEGEDTLYLDANDVGSVLASLPSTQPEIIRCNSCKYWTQTTGKMKGYGLGRCDFHDADLVACNGFCYWAERRNNE